MEITESTYNRNHIHSLSLLRGLASLVVCFFHLKLFVWKDENPNKLVEFFGVGNNGVVMFFVISGFVIPYSMYVKQYSISKFWKFLAKRTIRIEPPYIICIFILFFWRYYTYQNVWGGEKPIFDYTQFFLNITYLAPFFHVEWINIIFWTLAIEFQFYILTGLLFDLMMKNRWYKFSVFAVILAIGFIVPDRYLTLFDNYAYFIIGFQAFLYFIKKIKLSELLLSILFCLGFIYMYKEPAAVCYAAFTVAGIFLLNYNWKYGTFLGDISYSLYLSHGLVGGSIIMFANQGVPRSLVFAFAVFNCIGAAWLYYYFVEKRFLELSKKIKY